MSQKVKKTIFLWKVSSKIENKAAIETPRVKKREGKDHTKAKMMIRSKISFQKRS